MKEDYAEEFIAIAQTLAGKECWGIAAGRNTGSVIDLHFGQKLLRQQPIPNLELPTDLRLYNGELGVFIECAWRLDAESTVVCGWAESLLEGGPLSQGVKLLINQKVERVCLRRPGFDLSLYFENSLVLHAFCDQTEPSEDGDNYVLFTPRYSYVVSNKSKIVREERSEK